MSDQNKEINDIFLNKLKTIDVRTLERAIAKAVSELVGVEYDSCHIGNINYEFGFPFQGAKFDISLSVSRDKWEEERSASRAERLSSQGSGNDLP